MYSYRIAFLIRDLNYGGAAKMLTHYANIAAQKFNEVYIMVIGKVTNSSLYLNKNIKVVVLEKQIGRSNKILRIVHEIARIKEKIVEINPHILFPFVSGNVVFAYLAVQNKYFIVGAERGNPEALPMRLKYLCKYVYHRCNYMIFQSQGAADFYFKKGGRYDVIPNPCIVGDTISKRNKNGLIKIVSSSRLAKEKNIDIIFRAYKKTKTFNNSILYIYGEGPEEERLKSLAAKLEISDKVMFRGKVADIPEEIKDSDIFILVSSAEGMPNGLIEALALGIPCITTNCMTNNTNSLVENEVNGIIVKKRNILELADAIERIAENKEFAEKLSYNAIKIREELSEKVINTEIERMFNRLVSTMEDK